jgi:5-deoxy-D-glucuronate isomerase
VHREDENGKLLEADLEEIYFYKIDKPHGYAYQRVYTDDRSIDGLMMAQQHDMVLVPEGYHPVSFCARLITPITSTFKQGAHNPWPIRDDPAYKVGT